ncbi:MAG TPA: GNAT family N-acetyltransferase [Pseudonocardia sp.]|nr:GNAT family N-acetyltransferase [Pseudonocardia sp.]
MSTNNDIAVALLEPPDSRDVGLVEALSGLINRVYETAEEGLWVGGATRTTASELAGFIAAGQIAVASRHGQLVGSVRIHDLSTEVSEFGMLVAAPEHRGTGVGRALLDFVEQLGRDRGMRAIRLELLVPRGWRHPSKEFLKSLYGRSGYLIIRTGRIDDAYPHLAPLLATPCDLEIHEKPLDVSAEPSEPDGSPRQFEVAPWRVA